MARERFGTLDLWLGNLRRARDIQSFHQQTLQFISYPTVEGLAQAKQIRQMLEQAHVNLLMFDVSLQVSA